MDLKKMLNVTSVVHEPGNGTRYYAIACKVPENAYDWLVAFPELTRTAYVFSEGTTLYPSYVAEKLGRNSCYRLGDVDIHEMCKVIAHLVPKCAHMADTDDKGRFPEDYQLRVL